MPYFFFSSWKGKTIHPLFLSAREQCWRTVGAGTGLRSEGDVGGVEKEEGGMWDIQMGRRENNDRVRERQTWNLTSSSMSCLELWSSALSDPVCLCVFTQSNPTLCTSLWFTVNWEMFKLITVWSVMAQARPPGLQKYRNSDLTYSLSQWSALVTFPHFSFSFPCFFLSPVLFHWTALLWVICPHLLPFLFVCFPLICFFYLYVSLLAPLFNLLSLITSFP